MKQMFALIFSVLALAVLPVSASAEVLLKIEGVQGASVKKGYEGWVVAETMSYNFGPAPLTNRSLATRSSEGFMMEPAEMTLSDLEISRTVDADSYKLRNLLADGGIMNDIEIVVFADNGRAAPIMTYKVPRMALEGIAAGYGPDGGEETLRLRAISVTWLENKDL